MNDGSLLTGAFATSAFGAFAAGAGYGDPIERDPERWDPRPKRKASTEHGMTVCLTCGGVDGYPPGCRCER